MTRVVRAVTAPYRQHLKRWDLSPTEFAALEALYHQGPLPLSSLAELVFITGTSMTYAVKDIEARGIVRRRPSAEDQRVVFGELTDTGRALISKVFPEHTKLIRQGRRGLPRQEKRQAAELLNKLMRDKRSARLRSS